MVKYKLLFFSLCIYVMSGLLQAVQAQQSSSDDRQVKDQLIKDYYRFQKSEDERLLDSILRFVKLNKLEFKEDSITSKIRYLQGVNNLFLQRFEKAESLFQQSKVLAEKTNDVLLKGTIANSRGVTFSMGMKDFVTAEKLYREAIANFQLINELPQQIDAFYNLTVNSRKLQKWNKSNRYAQDCLELIAQYQFKRGGVKRLYYFIGDNYLKMNQLDKVEEYLQKSDSVHLRGDVYTEGLVDESYARLYAAKKEYERSLMYYEKAISNLRDYNQQYQGNIRASFVKELELENKVKIQKDSVIASQKQRLLLSTTVILLLVLLLILLFWVIRNNRQKKIKIQDLNEDLQRLIADLKNKNSDLVTNKKQIEELLQMNEQAMFSRVLKISTYNDTIRKISADIDAYQDNSSSSSPYLSKVNKKLLDLISEEELWEDFKIQFEKIRPQFFNKLKAFAPNLSVNDLKHCTYIVSNLKSKEVAQLINVSPRSVETTRYRIKKKLGLEREDNLYDLLSSL